MSDVSIFGTLASHGWKGVWVFYVLSGFIIPYSISQYPDQILSIKNFLLRRLLRIQPSYIAALALSIFVFGFLLENSDYFDLSAIIINFFYLAPFTGHNWLLSISWSLGVEAQFYIFIACFYRYLTSKNQVIRISVLALFISLFLVAKGLPEYHWCLLPTWSPFFATGLIVFLRRTGKISTQEFTCIALIVIPILLITWTKWFTLVAFLSGFVILYLPSNSKLKLPGYFLGKISYSFYLVHFPIMIAIKHYFIEPMNLVMKQPILSIFFLFTSAILVTIPFYYFVEKPTTAWSRLLRKRPS